MGSFAALRSYNVSTRFEVASETVLIWALQIPRWKLWLLRLGFGAFDEFQISLPDPFHTCNVPQHCARVILPISDAPCSESHPQVLQDPLSQRSMTVQLVNEIITCAELVQANAQQMTVRL